MAPKKHGANVAPAGGASGRRVAPGAGRQSNEISEHACGLQKKEPQKCPSASEVGASTFCHSSSHAHLHACGSANASFAVKTVFYVLLFT